MAPLFDVSWRASKSENEEVAQPRFSPFHIVTRVHGPQDVIFGDLPVESRYQPSKTLLSN